MKTKKWEVDVITLKYFMKTWNYNTNYNTLELQFHDENEC